MSTQHKATRRMNTVAGLLAFALATPCTLRAQIPSQSTLNTVAMQSDSAAWQSVMMHVVGRLSTELVRASIDERPQPWEFRLPANEPQRLLLEMQLRTILRARGITSMDSVTHKLEMEPLTITGDTARVRVSISETRSCPGTAQTTGFGWVETVLVGRHARLRTWGAAFSRNSLVGDRKGCP